MNTTLTDHSITWLKPNQIGPWRIENFTVDEDDAKMFNLQNIFAGIGYRGIRPGIYTRLSHAQRGVVMSNTPAEMMDLSDYFQALDRYVGVPLPVHIDGLGLGIAAVEALERGFIVEVVEIDTDIIALVGSILLERYGEDKLIIVPGDCLTFKPTQHYSVVWHDIWDEICTDNWEEYKLLTHRYGHRCRWQGSWARYEMLREMRNPW